jgi:hypothetical protein
MGPVSKSEPLKVKRSHCPLVGRSKNLALRGHASVRFGSEADMALLNLDVRFTPESGHPYLANSSCI